MQKPLLSVVVPVYKAEKYLHRCVDSILNQTLEDLELILVDDVVDSKWTLTVCGYLLMQSGCEQVVPFALADSSSKE